MTFMSVSKKPGLSRATQAEEYLIKDEPYYEPVGGEVDIFEAAFRQHCGFQVVLVSTPEEITERFAERGDPMYNLAH